MGQSHFRCDLAVRRPGDRVYRLGILTDGEAYYEQSDILERDVMRPKLLRNFGWNICQVFAKEWYEAPERVIHRVLQLIDGQSEAEPGHKMAEVSLDDSASIKADASAPKDVEAFDVAESSPFNAAALQSGLPPDGLEVAASYREASSAVADSDLTRYFEFANDSSNKFWQITLCGAQHSVRYGRIGTAGQELTKEFADATKARADFQRLIREKLAKGYREKT